MPEGPKVTVVGTVPFGSPAARQVLAALAASSSAARAALASNGAGGLDGAAGAAGAAGCSAVWASAEVGESDPAATLAWSGAGTATGGSVGGFMLRPMPIPPANVRAATKSPTPVQALVGRVRFIVASKLGDASSFQSAAVGANEEGVKKEGAIGGGGIDTAGIAADGDGIVAGWLASTRDSTSPGFAAATGISYTEATGASLTGATAVSGTAATGISRSATT